MPLSPLSTTSLACFPTTLNSHTCLLSQEAIAARDQTHGYKLDRSHTFAVTLFDDFERYAKVPEQYQDPAPQPYKPTVRICSDQGSIEGLIQGFVPAGI